MRSGTNAQGCGGNAAEIDRQPHPATLLVDMSGIEKRFPGVLALDQIDFQLLSG